MFPMIIDSPQLFDPKPVSLRVKPFRGDILDPDDFLQVGGYPWQPPETLPRLVGLLAYYQG
jgi:hypothetical protein